jgi:hypothetical protein
MKHKTNKQVLTKAIKEMNDFSVAILRAHILDYCDSILNLNADQLEEQYGKSFIAPALLVSVAQEIKSKVDFSN